jgi:hypothetical protein
MMEPGVKGQELPAFNSFLKLRTGEVIEFNRATLGYGDYCFLVDYMVVPADAALPRLPTPIERKAQGDARWHSLCVRITDIVWCFNATGAQS